MKHLRLRLVPLAATSLLIVGCGGDQTAIPTTTTGTAVVAVASETTKQLTADQASINFTVDVLNEAYKAEMSISPSANSSCGSWQVFEHADENGIDAITLGPTGQPSTYFFRYCKGKAQVVFAPTPRPDEAASQDAVIQP